MINIIQRNSSLVVVYITHRTSSSSFPVSVVPHLADRGVLRGENSRLLAAPETLFLPVFLPCCRRPELGAVRGENMVPVAVLRTAPQPGYGCESDRKHN